MSGVHKMVKQALKTFQHLLEDFDVCLTNLLTPGIISLTLIYHIVLYLVLYLLLDQFPCLTCK